MEDCRARQAPAPVSAHLCRADARGTAGCRGAVVRAAGWGTSVSLSDGEDGQGRHLSTAPCPQSHTLCRPPLWGPLPLFLQRCCLFLGPQDSVAPCGLTLPHSFVTVSLFQSGRGVVGDQSFRCVLGAVVLQEPLVLSACVTLRLQLLGCLLCCSWKLGRD